MMVHPMAASAIPDIDDTPMRSWLDEPVRYRGLLVTRGAAFRLCADETRDWARIDEITDLAAERQYDAEDVLDAATAFDRLMTAHLELRGRLSPGIARKGRDF